MSAQEDLIKPLPIKAVGDTLRAPELPELLITRDSVRPDSVRPAEGALMDKVKYKAKDYVRINQKEKRIYLYNEAEIYYQDTELKAGIIVLDYVNNEVYAGRIRDSLGN